MQGLLGITLDNKDVLLVNISQDVGRLGKPAQANNTQHGHMEFIDRKDDENCNNDQHNFNMANLSNKNIMTKLAIHKGSQSEKLAPLYDAVDTGNNVDRVVEECVHDMVAYVSGEAHVSQRVESQTCQGNQTAEGNNSGGQETDETQLVTSQEKQVSTTKVEVNLYKF